LNLHKTELKPYYAVLGLVFPPNWILKRSNHKALKPPVTLKLSTLQSSLKLYKTRSKLSPGTRKMKTSPGIRKMKGFYRETVKGTKIDYFVFISCEPCFPNLTVLLEALIWLRLWEMYLEKWACKYSRRVLEPTASNC